MEPTKKPIIINFLLDELRILFICPCSYHILHLVLKKPLESRDLSFGFSDLTDFYPVSPVHHDIWLFFEEEIIDWWLGHYDDGATKIIIFYRNTWTGNFIRMQSHLSSKSLIFPSNLWIVSFTSSHFLLFTMIPWAIYVDTAHLKRLFFLTWLLLFHCCGLFCVFASPPALFEGLILYRIRLRHVSVHALNQYYK